MGDSPLALSHAEASSNSDRIRLVMALRKAGITDTAVLGAMEAVPRALFISDAFADRAYDDTALPIDCEQTISQPSVVAAMSVALEVGERHTVLEIGTGSGYQAAILAKLARRVHTIERHAALAEQARARFEALRLHNITPHRGDGTQGWVHAAPYDRIMVTAAAEEIPPALLEQLAPGGVMVLPVGEVNEMQQLLRVRKDAEGEVVVEELLNVRFVPLVED